MDILTQASRLEALGNPTRLAIYRALVRAGHAGAPVGKLQEAIGIPASTLSHHLAQALRLRPRRPDARGNGAALPCPFRRHGPSSSASSSTNAAPMPLRRPATRKSVREPQLRRKACFLIRNIRKDRRKLTCPRTCPVVVIGAGARSALRPPPSWPSAACPSSSSRRGPAVASAMAEWAHVRLFSPWSFNVAPRRQSCCWHPTGWQRPPGDVHPTGGEVVSRYLIPLAAHPAIAPALRDRNAGRCGGPRRHGPGAR
jgi:DNA-binding transcriptional ArsR family regulator